MKRGRENCRFVVEGGGVVTSLKVRADALVQPGEVVCVLRRGAVVDTVSFRQQQGEEEECGDALVLDVKTHEGASLSSGDVLFEFRWCSHALVVHGLCVGCHQDLSKMRKPAMKKMVRLQPSQPDMLFNKDKASSLSEQTRARLLQTRKLSLVLDLDLTLLHASHDPRHSLVASLAPQEDAEEIHEFELGAHKFWVKLRPGLRQFLQRANELFELHIFTHGTRDYGWRIASILDPEGKMFGALEGIGEKRITTLDEAYGHDEKLAKNAKGLHEYKRLDRLFPLDQQRHVLVLDDNNVWGDCPNVLRVIPYLFFNLRLPEHFPGEFVSNTESDVDVIPVSQLYAAEAARDSHLSDLLRVLERVHELFFLDPSRSVVEMFGQARREVLAGCSIVLSGIYAMNTRRDKRWMEILAQDYGAQVQEEVVPGVTTHVVAAQDGTQKVKAARAAGIVVVNASWLSQCFRRFRRVDERMFFELPTDRKPEMLASRMDKLLEELAQAYCGARVADTVVLQHREEEEEALLEELRLQMEHVESSHSEF